MIQEGKRAVSRELTQILEFVDKVLVREHHKQMVIGDALETDVYHDSAGRHTIILMQPSKNRGMRTSMDFDSVNHALDVMRLSHNVSLSSSMNSAILNQ
ncbi:hypothetical protein U9M48_025955 [Paspalum notatum var. saurae]|uniref:Uncharacterized protein n=1 Tax=Paspalum notatum var. saurae TaxID=547442 RepID=A0AAQ3WYW6_PASNO